MDLLVHLQSFQGVNQVNLQAEEAALSDLPSPLY